MFGVVRGVSSAPSSCGIGEGRRIDEMAVMARVFASRGK